MVTMRNRHDACFAAAAALALTTLSALDARADWVVGADLHAAFPIARGNVPPPAFGFDGRFGYRLGVGPIFVQPELDGGYVGFTGAHMARFMVGGRLGLDGIFQPQLFAHGGVGTTDVGYETDFGYRFDGGLALDLKAIPLLSLGLHGAFNVAGANGMYATAGGHAGLHF